MCGIFGIMYAEDRSDLGTVLTKAAECLTYRGYDSVGAVAVTRQGQADLRKDVGKIEDVAARLKFHELEGNRGIAQLRWATFGVPAQRNAQPHFDTHHRLVGAHNGNVINTVQLIRDLSAKGHIFRGENDGEVVVHALEESYNKHGDLDRAVREARLLLKGDYAFIITALDGDRLFAAKMGSSLYLGVGPDFILVSSDLPSILWLTNRIVTLNDGEYVEFNQEHYEIRSIETGSKIERLPIESKLSPDSASKGDYAFFMQKEIHEQPDRCQALLDFLAASEEVRPFAEELAASKRTYIIGSGSSYNACVIGSYYLNRIGACSTYPVVASAFSEHFGESIRPDDTCVLISQSGETKDLINVLNLLTKRGLANNVLGVVNVLGSTLMMRSRRYLPLLSNLEIAVAATKTFTNQIVLFLALAIEVAKMKGRAGTLIKILQKTPRAIADTIAGMEGAAAELGSRYRDCNDMYTLGYSLTYGSALEAAQKIKEISYAHCEGMYSAEFKHGPLAIITEGYPVFYLSTLEDRQMMLSHINEVTCRQGTALTVSPPSEELEKSSSVFLPLPHADQILVPVLSVVFMQLFAYHLTVEKGFDPDYPRNCSKTITVD
ncbi:glutamine--fructose-6-phosphate transaminase (isomerizing) [bacterium]|nr:glutamine--fructose-6-phosphate transaminase (isomerizing) [bacterium]